VHRDFKPDNVLVGDDGRVRVTDFGLVSVDGVEMSSTDVPIDTSLTHTGAIMGTPRYMAPEQHQSADVDVRADQFAFCVALYEALYGQPPFAGDTYSELSKNVCEGALRATPTANVPAAIRDAIIRGFSRRRDCSTSARSTSTTSRPRSMHRAIVWVRAPCSSGTSPSRRRRLPASAYESKSSSASSARVPRKSDLRTGSPR
jgi:serine/threonine protein kinase